METLYGLTAEQVSRLKTLLSMVELTEQVPAWNKRRRRPLTSAKVVVGALTSAASATTALLGKPKMAVLNVYEFTSTGTVDTGIDVDVYNFAPQAATTDRWTVAERDSFTGKYVITTQFCS